MADRNVDMTKEFIAQFNQDRESVTLRLKCSGYDLDNIYIVGEGTDHDTRTGTRSSENYD